MPRFRNEPRVTPRQMEYLLEGTRFYDAYKVCDGNLSRTAAMLKIGRRALEESFSVDESGKLWDARHELDNADNDAAQEMMRKMARGEIKATGGMVAASMAWLKSRAGWIDKNVVEHRGRVEYEPVPRSVLRDELGEGEEPAPVEGPQTAILKIAGGKQVG